LTVEIGGDTTKLGKALEDVNKKSRDLSSELGEINKMLKFDPGNADLLAQKQKVLADAISTTAKKLETLEEAEKQVQEQFARGEVSEEQVRALQREIITTSKKLKSYEKAAEDTANALKEVGDNSADVTDGTTKTKKGADKAADSLDDLADSANEAGDASDGLGSKLGSVAKGGLTAIVGAAAAAVGALVGATEASREYRNEMGKLDTAFTTNGHSSQAAYETYSSLQGVLGETEQAVEAANHLAKLTDNEKDLQRWTDICTGVYATFGASLPIEGLTEAANETAKLGQLTGPLADALNWAGVNEEKFQEQLDACSNEQERQTLIMETLTGLYSDAAGKFKETNAEVIRANEANEKWAASMGDIGAVVEPILTDIKLLGSSLLSDLVPGVKTVAEAFRGILNGDEGAADALGDSLSSLLTGLLNKVVELAPTVAETALSLITSLGMSLLSMTPQLLSTGFELVMSLIDGLTSALPQIMQQGAQVLVSLGEGIGQNLPSLVERALDALMGFATALYDNAPVLIESGLSLISNLVQGVIDSLPILIEKGPEIISKFANIINDNFPTILMKGVQLIGQLVLGIIQAIPTLVKNIPKIITAIVDVWEAFNWLNLGKKAITFLKDGVLKMVGSVKSAGKAVVDGCVNVIKNLPSKLLSLGKSATQSLSGAISGAVGAVKSAATSIFNGIVNVIKGLPAKMLGIGKDLVRGLWNGISDMAGWVIGKIQGFGDSVLGGIKKFFGIKSPSRVFRDEVGKMLGLGLAEGIEGSADEPIKAMADLSAGVLDEAADFNGLTLERQMQHTFANPEAAAQESGVLGTLDKILAAIERGQIIAIDGDALVGATADRIDRALGQRRILAARGAV
jgi:phage-related protein